MQVREKILSSTNDSSKSKQSEENFVPFSYLDNMDSICCLDSEIVDTNACNLDFIGFSLHSIEGASVELKTGSIVTVDDKNVCCQGNVQWLGYPHTSLSDFSVYIRMLSGNSN